MARSYRAALLLSAKRDGQEAIADTPDYNFLQGEDEMAEEVKETKDVYLPTVGDVEVKAEPGVKNWKVLIFTIGSAVALTILNTLTTIDWTQYVDPSVAVYISLAVSFLLRFFTSGPVGSSVSVKKV